MEGREGKAEEGGKSGRRATFHSIMYGAYPLIFA